MPLYTYLAWLTYFTRDGEDLSVAWKLSSWPAVDAYFERIKARPAAAVVPLGWVYDMKQYLL